MALILALPHATSAGVGASRDGVGLLTPALPLRQELGRHARADRGFRRGTSRGTRPRRRRTSPRHVCGSSLDTTAPPEHRLHPMLCDPDTAMAPGYTGRLLPQWTTSTSPRRASCASSGCCSAPTLRQSTSASVPGAAARVRGATAVVLDGGRGGAHWRRHEPGRRDEEHEGEALHGQQQRVARERVAEHDDSADDAGDVRGGSGHRDHRDGFAFLQTLGGSVEGSHRRDQAEQRPRRQQSADAVAADQPGDRLDCDVRDAEEDARGGAQHEPVMLSRRSDASSDDEQRPRSDQAGLEREHARDRDARVGAVNDRKRHTEEHQPEGGSPQSDPLTTADPHPEEPFGHHGKQDHAAGQHRLHERHRRHR